MSHALAGGFLTTAPPGKPNGVTLYGDAKVSQGQNCAWECDNSRGPVQSGGTCTVPALGCLRNILGQQSSISAAWGPRNRPPCLLQNHCYFGLSPLPLSLLSSEGRGNSVLRRLLQPHVPLMSGHPLITDHLISRGDLLTPAILSPVKCGFPGNAAKEACRQTKQVYSRLTLCRVPIGWLESGSRWAFSGEEAWFRWGKGPQAGGRSKARDLRSLFVGSIESLVFTFVFP